MWVFFFCIWFSYFLCRLSWSLPCSYNISGTVPLLCCFQFHSLLKSQIQEYCKAWILLSNYCLKCSLLFLSTVPSSCALTISNDSTTLYRHSISEFLGVSVQNNKSKNTELRLIWFDSCRLFFGVKQHSVLKQIARGCADGSRDR